MTPQELLEGQLTACSSAAQAMLSDESCKNYYVKSHNFLTDLSMLCEVLPGSRTQDVFKLGIKEYQFAVLAACLGLYRQAFSALRLAMELSLAAVEFSANERKLRGWLRGEVDITWQALINDDTGVFARNFVKVFCDHLSPSAPQYRVLSEKLYRECSEFVHGNIATHKVMA